MRPLAVLTLAAGLLAVARAEDPKADPLAGKWVIESVTREGKDDDSLKGAVRVHEGGKYTITPPEGSKAAKVEGTYTADATKNPPTIDMKPSGGRYKDKTLLGIYKLSGGRLIICFADPGKDRPTEFESKPGSGTTVAIHGKAK